MLCDDVPSNVSYDCAHPWGEDCTAHDKGFDFVSLWKYTERIASSCLQDPRLFQSAYLGHPSLTQKACSRIAGFNYNVYPGEDIWTRLTTWKFPLLQLAFLFPRPPLNFWTETLVVFHLLGDPIDTLRNLLVTLSDCQRSAELWKGFLDGSEEWKDDWKSLTLITASFSEFERDEQVRHILQHAVQGAEVNSEDLKEIIHDTRQSLAADRSTKSLPVFFAQLFFIASVGIAVFRTASAAHTAALNTTIFINVEAHSIAFSALYFWLIPAVIFGAVIGVSQTAAAIPCDLRRFQKDLGETLQLPVRCLDELETRQYHGGIYTWRPAKYQHDKHVSQNLPLPSLPSESRLHHTILATTIVAVAVITGMTISALVPPDGLSCRHIGQLAVLACWLLSFLLNRLLNRLLPLNRNNDLLFSLTLIKDILATLTCIADVILIQIGFLNRCACYTQWGRTGLALPQRPDIDAILRERIHTWYLGITIVGIAVQLVLVPAYVLWRYWDGVRVFVQKDDGRSNLPTWAWRVISSVRKLQALVLRVRMSFRRKRQLLRRKTRMIKAQVLEGRDAGNVDGVLETGLQSAAKPNATHVNTVQD